MKTCIISLLSGILFGAGLAISGMTNPQKVLNFLTISPQWDISLAFVMIGALLITIPSFTLISKAARPILKDRFSLPNTQSIDRPLIIGSVMFGLGWGLVGWCPGPALASLAYLTSRLDLNLLYFIVSMFIGMKAAHAIQRQRQ